MTPTDLLAHAGDLSRDARGPSQVRLRRAVSSTYYAAFHALAAMAANEFVGSEEATRDNTAWLRVYRALDHGYVRQQCRDKALSTFPREIQEFAEFFVTLQLKRHSADYDPVARFEPADVEVYIEQAHLLITSFLAAPARDRRAFAAFVLLKSRRD